MDEIGAIRELVTQLRALKAERNLSNKQVEFFHLSDEQEQKPLKRMKLPFFRWLELQS